MSFISELERSLNKHFDWNKARMNCFARMLLSLITVRTVNLKSLAVASGSKAQIDSRYRRFQRFLAQFPVDFSALSRWIVSAILPSDFKCYLVMDRTNWDFGKTPINVFMLSIAYEGLAIPVFWNVLPKDGTSSGEEQIALITRFIEHFGKDHIVGLLADREFINGALLSWLDQQGIHFYIRIKGNLNVCIPKKKLSNAADLFRNLNVKHQSVFPISVWICEQKVYLVASRSERGELMIVATNHLRPKNAVFIYLRRWEIENLFQGLKGRGFNFEETHLTIPERIEKLVALLAVGFVWAHKVGEFRSIQKPILFKKFKDQQQRPQYSIFRYGLDFISDAISQASESIRPLKNLIKFIEIPSSQEAT